VPSVAGLSRIIDMDRLDAELDERKRSARSNEATSCMCGFILLSECQIYRFKRMSERVWRKYTQHAAAVQAAA
jgi:hypothetical protein